MRKKIVIFTCLSLVLLLALTSCSSKKSDKKKADRIDSIFEKQNSVSTSTTSPYVRDPNTPINSKFTPAEQKKFYDLKTVGTIDKAHPEKYLSPRWYAILGEDRPIGIVPISELDKSINSSLSKVDFDTVTKRAVEISQIQHTGIGIESYPDYFANVKTDACTLYKKANAGATSLPITSETWAMAMVISSAKCPQTGELHAIDRLEFYDYFYFVKQNGTWKPVEVSSLPKG